MKGFVKLLILGAALAASAPLASATPITGGISVGGTDTYNNQQITFTPSTGVITGSSGSLALLAPAFSTVNLTSFAFANSNGVVLFSNAGITFTINGSILATIDPVTQTLTLKGNGTFTENGFDPTAGSFTLSTSQNGQVIGFSIQSSVPSATPEPSSLVLLGTGLLGAAGAVFRKRSIVS